jgi:hypothetical protein
MSLLKKRRHHGSWVPGTVRHLMNPEISLLVSVEVEDDDHVLQKGYMLHVYPGVVHNI